MIDLTCRVEAAEEFFVKLLLLQGVIAIADFLEEGVNSITMLVADQKLITRDDDSSDKFSLISG